jgi:hypothetical protein
MEDRFLNIYKDDNQSSNDSIEEEKTIKKNYDKINNDSDESLDFKKKEKLYLLYREYYSKIEK